MKSAFAVPTSLLYMALKVPPQKKWLVLIHDCHDLVGGLEYVLFSHLLGIIPIDELYFSEGWLVNHQAVIVGHFGVSHMAMGQN